MSKDGVIFVCARGRQQKRPLKWWQPGERCYVTLKGQQVAAVVLASTKERCKLRAAAYNPLGDQWITSTVASVEAWRLSPRNKTISALDDTE